VKKISYKNAGVDIDKGNSFVQVIKPMVESTFRPEVLTKIGGFAGCVSLNLERYKKPILVSSTDGVGTKLKIDRRDFRQASVSGAEGFIDWRN
jgi:phosphoribosylformylglycinamidine cyclo-ligase